MRWLGHNPLSEMDMDFKKYLNDTRLLTQFTRILFLALLALTLGFASYYYFDRYVHVGDQSPVERSVAELETAVRKEPKDPARRVALAEAYLQDKNYSAAMEQAQQVLKSYPDNDSALFVMGLSNVFQENRTEALPFLEKFIEIRGKAETAGTDMGLETGLYFLGESYNKLKRAPEAVVVLTKALNINRADADAMFQLGLAYASTNEHEKAIAQYQDSIRFVPDFAEAYQAMVISYTALNQTDFVTYANGMVLFSKKDYPAALTLLKESAQKMPKFVPAYIGLGLTYEQMGDLVSASATLEQATQIEPDNYTVAQALGRIKSNLGK
jgi:tetratricopeptide (TPR) repeat protein